MKRFNGEIVRQYRKEHKLSLREMGKLIGVSHQQVANIEAGGNIGVKTFIRIMNVTGHEPNEFFK